MAIQYHCINCKADYSLQHEKCPCCGVLSTQKNRTYRIILRQDGKKVTRIVPTLTLAREVEAKLKGDIVRGEHAIARKKVAITFADYFTKFYMPWAKEHKLSWLADQNRYELHLKDTFGNKPIDSIIPFDIQRLISKLKRTDSKKGKPFAPATINLLIALLSKVFNRAIKDHKLNSLNPCLTVEKLKLDNEIINYLSSEETERLLQVLKTWPDKTAASLIMFDMVAGVRRSSLFRLKWDDVTLESQEMRIYLKGGKHVKLMLSDYAVEILKSLSHVSEYVFPGKPVVTRNPDGTITKKYSQRTDIKHSWAAIKRAAGINRPFRFHDIRHNLASKLVSNGATLFEVQMALAHKDPKTTMRYAHLVPERMKLIADMGAQLVTSPSKKEKTQKEIVAGAA